MTARVVVLGANAFSASHFVAHALSQGAEVLGISRSAEPGAAFLPYRGQARSSHYRFLQLDLNLDLPRILRDIEAFAPDAVVDFAGQGMVAESWQDPAQWFQTNVLSKVKLHEGLRQLKGLQKYVRISTPEVYGSTSGAVREVAPLNPSTPYAVTHASIDMSLRTYFQRYGFPVAFTRSSNFYGPGQQLYRIIPRAILSAMRGEKLPLHGGGHAIRNFLYIDDFCEAVWKVMSAAPAGELYHLASEEYLSIRQVVERIAALMGVPFDDLVEIAEDRPSKDAAYYLDTAKIRSELGWVPTVSFDEGLRRTLAWAKTHASDLAGQSLVYVHKA
jgi:dTDP-glucose 4,6-dehydratase